MPRFLLSLALAAALLGAGPAAGQEEPLPNLWTTREDFLDKAFLTGLEADSSPGDVRLVGSPAPATPVGEPLALARGVGAPGGLDLLANPGRGEHLLSWNSRGEFLVRRLDPGGSPLGAPRRVAGDGRLAAEGRLALLPGARKFAAVWVDGRVHAPGVYGVLLGADAERAGEEFVVTNSREGSRSNPAVAAGGRPEGFLVAWKELRNTTRLLLVRAFTAGGSPRGPARVVPGTANPQAPLLVWSPEAGAYLLFWTDLREGNADIMLQRLEPDGTPAGTPVAVRKAPHGEQASDAVYHRGLKRVLLLWDDYRGGDTEVYAQVLLADGTPEGAETAVTAAAKNQLHGRGVALEGLDSWLVTWQDGRAGRNYEDWNILARLVGRQGVAGEETSVCDTPGRQFEPVAAFDAGSGRALVAWSHQVDNDMMDLGGRLLRKGYLPGGRARFLAESASPNPVWVTLKWGGATPLGTSILVRFRGAGGAWSPWQRETAPRVTDVHGSRLEFELLLQTSDPDVSPTLHDVFVRHR